MITKLDVRKSNSGVPLELPLYSDAEGFQVTNIDGLDPVQTSLVASSFAGIDGEYFQGSRREPRNIRITLVLDVGHPTLSVEDIRRGLYQWFAQKIPLDIRFYSSDIEDPILKITGRVETVEAPVFTKDPSMIISLICHDPSFVNVDETLTGGFSTSSFTGTNISYDGTVETGFTFVFPVDRAVTEFYIASVSESGVNQSLSLAELDLLAGDMVIINTNNGQKEIRRIRSGMETSLLHKMLPASQWVNLFPGQNNFIVYSPGDPIPYTLEYFEKYGGL